MCHVKIRYDRGTDTLVISLREERIEESEGGIAGVVGKDARLITVLRGT
jgi:hypothetical protein